MAKKTQQKVKVTPTKAKKIKFLDLEDEGFVTAEEDAEEDAEEITPEEEKEVDSESESDSDSDSDDAPEEESTSTSRQAIIEQQKEAFKIRQEKNRQERERRRQLDLQNKQQQEEARKTKKDRVQEEMPEYLPTDLLESDDEETTTKIQPKHIKLDKEDEKEIRKQMLMKKLGERKKERQSSIKKGPVNVQVQTFNSKKKVVPVAENKIINSREQWLKRKSLGKK